MKPSEFFNKQIYDYGEQDSDAWKELDSHFIERKETINIIGKMINFRNGERTNNNIFRKSSDELNEDFIESLEQLKKEIAKS